MCLAIPGKLVKKEGEIGTVDFGGIAKDIALNFVPEAKPGDWLIVHTGFALNIISEKDARETIALIREAYG
ncbi:MAG: HypC/HybG/HupF family hydrogenase formation chaperone [Candidatus Cloacimonetes bacterium]|nr:HypC/HybG/HupF family hydrogenase formation chaperone [Candidatus Cloacimonadota bacterium]